MFFTKINADINNGYDRNEYIYEYLLTDNQASVNHFISEKYSKEGNERKEIAWSKAYICTNDDSCVAQFRQSHNTQLFHIAKLGIQKPVDRNKGIMTIIMCDIILAILDREFAWGENIEVSLNDRSGVQIGEFESRSTTIYHRIFRGYEKGIDTTNERLVVKGVYVNYLFPKETRKEDIAYYENLRSEKIERFKKLM